MQNFKIKTYGKLNELVIEELIRIGYELPLDDLSFVFKKALYLVFGVIDGISFLKFGNDEKSFLDSKEQETYLHCLIEIPDGSLNTSIKIERIIKKDCIHHSEYEDPKQDFCNEPEIGKKGPITTCEDCSRYEKPKYFFQFGIKETQDFCDTRGGFINRGYSFRFKDVNGNELESFDDFPSNEYFDFKVCPESNKIYIEI